MVKKTGLDNRFLIREAVTEDLPVMVEFLAKLALHVSGAPSQSLKAPERDRLLEVLRTSLPDPDKLLVVAEVPQVGLVGMGYLYVWRNQGIWEQAGEVEFTSGIIDDVWVEPEYRKIGVFRALLRNLVAFAESRGVHELVLEYAASNKEAKAAWGRLGFKTIGIRAAAFTDTVRDVLDDPH